MIFCFEFLVWEVSIWDVTLQVINNSTAYGISPLKLVYLGEDAGNMHLEDQVFWGIHWWHPPNEADLRGLNFEMMDCNISLTYCKLSCFAVANTYC